MNYFFKSSVVLLFIMLFTIRLKAQKNIKEPQMMWQIAISIPPPPGASQQFGIAGAWAGIHHNVLLIGGGANFPDGMPWLGGKKKYYKDVYAFLKNEEGTLSLLSNNLQLPFPIAYGASCSTPKGIVCAGGENEQGLSNQVILLQWSESEKNISFQSLPPLPLPLSNPSITHKENIVYLAGGEGKSGVSTSFFSLDLENTAAGWKVLPSLSQPTSHADFVLQSTRKGCFLYLIGGRKRTTSGISDLYSSVFAYDLKKEIWEEKKPLPYALSAGTGLGYSNNKILLFGGDKGETFHKTEELIAAINSEKDAAKKEALMNQKTALQAAHPGFSKDVLQYNTTTDQWKVIMSIPFDVPVTTVAVSTGDEVFLTSGEIKAGVRTPYILVGKLKEAK